MEISAQDMESRARVFVSVRTKDMRGARGILQAGFDDVLKAAMGISIIGIIIYYIKSFWDKKKAERYS